MILYNRHDHYNMTKFFYKVFISRYLREVPTNEDFIKKKTNAASSSEK